MVQTKFDEMLVTLEGACAGKRFINEMGSARSRVDPVEWKAVTTSLTFKIKTDGSCIARPDLQRYGLSPAELPVVRGDQGVREGGIQA